MSKVSQLRVVEKDRVGALAVPDEVSVALTEIAQSAKAGLLALSVGVGMQVLDAMFAEEIAVKVGERGRHDAGRSAVRHGSEDGRVVLGGRTVPVRRPRARTTDGQEVSLDTYRHFQDPELLSAMTMERMLAGLSTRRYSAGLEPVGDGVRAGGTSRAAVSRRFVDRTARAMHTLMGRDLSAHRFVAVFIDGIEIAEHCCIVVLGVDDQGTKHPLGVREGTTENKVVCRELLSDIVGRGLSFQDGILVVLDGGKGLRAAVNVVFGALALVHRCVVHKRRNVLGHLPKALHAMVGRKVDKAWAMTDAKAAQRALEDLARSLEDTHPGAAASIREGLADTLTVMRLGLPPALARTFRSTNPIESMLSIVRDAARNVKRWRDGKMVCRWTAAGVLEAERKFRRVKGCTSMSVLVAALAAHAQSLSSQDATLQESA